MTVSRVILLFKIPKLHFPRSTSTKSCRQKRIFTNQMPLSLEIYCLTVLETFCFIPLWLVNFLAISIIQHLINHKSKLNIQGIKVVNLFTNKCVKVIGKGETLRCVQVDPISDLIEWKKSFFRTFLYFVFRLHYVKDLSHPFWHRSRSLLLKILGWR